MKRRTEILMVLGASIFLYGCGDEPATEQEALAQIPTSSKTAATQLERVFEDVPDAESQQHSRALAAAMRQNNYNEALKSLGALSGQQAHNMNQALAIENAKRRLQADILEAMERGDPRAKRAWERMKRAGRN